MPEVIDKDLVFNTLRKLHYSANESISKHQIPGIKRSTLKKIKEIMNDRDLAGERGKRLLSQQKEDRVFSCPDCRSGVNLKQLEDEIRTIKSMLKQRPSPTKKWDQKPLKAKHNVIRAAAIYEADRLFDKKIICVGDYDSVSLSLSLLAKPKEVAVVDIDRRLLDFLSNQAEEYDFPLTTYQHDLAHGLPSELEESYDLFVTDPPYALSGMRQFIECGIDSLVEQGTGYISLPYHDNLPWSREMMYYVQELLIGKEMVLSDILKNLFAYNGADGLNSSLLRVCRRKKVDLSDKESFYWWNKERPKTNHPEVRL